MATVNYLSGGERPTNYLMNLLWGEFETRCTKILAGGKSFALSRDSGIPQKLCGKVFYFTSGSPVYALRFPGPQSAGAPVPYNHAVFSNYLSTVDPATITWDDANRVAKIPRVPDASYGTFETPGADTAFGFFEHSLQVMTLQHTGTGDTSPQTYYVKDGDDAVVERRLDWALAEIVIEGTTDLNLPVTWDKYRCFRVHNLNPFSVVLSFDGYYSVTLQPFECRTVRRETPITGYASESHYFFPYRAGDPRFYWYLPTRVDLVIGTEKASIGQGPRAANAMQANNLTNAALLLDWVNWLALTEADFPNIAGLSNGVIQDPDDGSHRFAWLVRDPSIVWDAHALNAGQFGDPDNSATILGDLIHHSGDIIIARLSRSATDPDTGNPVVTWDRVTFNGYATIVSDFAAKHLAVSVNGSGDLQITNTDPDNDVDLIPVSTNLLKSGETLPVLVPLNNIVSHADVPFTLEHAIFEIDSTGADFALSDIPPVRVRQRSLETVSQSRSYTDFDPTTGVGTTTSVSGPDLHFVQVASAPTHTAIHGIHALTVSDVLDLHLWGNSSLGSQDTTYGTFTSKTLRLTSEGLFLSFVETITNTPPDPASTEENDWYYWQTGQFTRNRVIRFRGHGWGYNSRAVDGSYRTAFELPRYGSYSVANNFTADAFAGGGDDFGWQPLKSTETDAKLLNRIKTGGLSLASLDCRFWQNNLGSTNQFLDNYQTAGWYFTNRNALYAGTLVTTDLRAMALLPEHYNALAQAVNQCTSGGALSGAALQWRNPVTGNLVSLAPTLEAFPVPMTCYASFGSGSDDDRFWLYNHLGITVYGESDFPDDLTSYEEDMSLAGVLRWDCAVTGSVTAVHVVSTDGTADGSITATYGLTLSGQRLPVESWKNGTGSGTGYKGAWVPTSSLPTLSPNFGDYYVASQSGYSPDLLVWFQKGDALMNRSGFWQRWSSALQSPAFAYCPQVNSWWQLRPSSVGTIDAFGNAPVQAVTSKGTWNPATSLPTGTFAHGDYYDITATAGGYFKGARIIWDGSTWAQAQHQYADFNWVTIAAVKAWMEAHGFYFILNELLIPLEFDRVEPTDSYTHPNSQLGASGTVVLNSVGFIGSGSTANALLDAQSMPFTESNFADVRTNNAADVNFQYPGTRLQWTSISEGSAAWKLRRDWWALLSGYDDTRNRVGDLQNWTDDTDGTENPPTMETAAIYVEFAGDSKQFTGTHGWQIRLPGWTGGVGGALSLNGITIPSDVWFGESFTTYAGIAWKGADAALWQQGATMDNPLTPPLPGEVSPWQFAAFAVQSSSSAAVSGSSVIKIVPCGSWSWDGDEWRTSDTGFKKSGMGTYIPEWNDAAGATQTITPAAGVTFLVPPSGSLAFLMPRVHMNAIALS